MRLLLLAAVLLSLAQAPSRGSGIQGDLELVGPATAAPFTELETARLEAIAQEGRALDAEQRLLAAMRERWQGKVAAFKAAAERERPGFTWNAETGAWSEVKK